MIVNLFGYSRESLGAPTNYEMLFESPEPCHVLLIQDAAILKYLHSEEQQDPRLKIVLRMCEDKTLFAEQMYVYYNLLDNKSKKVDMLLTWDEELLKLPYARFCPVTDSTQWAGCTEEDFKVYPKTKLLSAISSNKTEVPGHVTRLSFIYKIKHRLDLYGRGFKEIENKLEGLKDYMFSVAIENSTSTNCFTEKIQDCFLTGTIPIYYGPKNIGEYFDMDGILTFNTQDELNSILDSLNEDLYYSKIEAIQRNYKRALSYPTFNNSLYDLYFKDIII